MSTRIDWGWFDANGKPIAVGDAWHKWECPRAVWTMREEFNPYTGETESDGTYERQPCPTRSVDAKRDVCTRCNNVFVYP